MDDISQVLIRSMLAPTAPVRPAAGADASLAIFNVVDDEPAPAHSVNLLACRLTGTPPPPVVKYAAAEPAMSAMAKSFYGDSKRVSNRRIKLVLGAKLSYPTYREGLRACIEEEGTGVPPESSPLHGASDAIKAAVLACAKATSVPESVRRGPGRVKRGGGAAAAGGSRA